MSFVLIIGSRSDIGKALAREFANDGFDLYLASRDAEQNRDFATDIQVRYGRKAQCIELDILDVESHRACYESLQPRPEGVVVAVGYLGDQKTAEADFTEARKIIDTNYTGIASVLDIVAGDFESRGSGFIVGISSVAGDRGRQGNYFYGSAKAALSVYLSGLRNRLARANVRVLTAKPGFVNTKMTSGLALPAALTAQPEDVATAIFNACKAGRNVVYVPRKWRWIMLVIRAIPEFIFKRISV